MRTGEVLGLVCVFCAGWNIFFAISDAQQARDSKYLQTQHERFVTGEIVRPSEWGILGALCFIHARIGRIWLPRNHQTVVEATTVSDTSVREQLVTPPPIIRSPRR